jgi:predicted CXXCH cytochrome family protein
MGTPFEVVNATTNGRLAMLKLESIKKASRPVAAIWLLTGAVVGFAPVAAAFSPASAVLDGQKTCLFSVQLQTSAEIRKEYLAKVIEITGRTDLDDGAPAAGYVEQEDPLKFWVGDGKSAAGGVTVDSMSKDCLSCHDGVSASVVNVELRNQPWRRTSLVSSVQSDHPIGMDYNRYVSSNRGYQPVLAGTTKMLFVDGKVGCLTCHNPLNPEKGHLVMSDRQSALCKTCHRK